MENNLHELESILKQELDIHNDLYETALLFNGAIKKNNIDLMQQHTIEQDEKICLIERLEETRKNCCMALSNSFDPPIKVFKLSAFIDSISPEWKEKLSHLHISLKSTINRLTKINTSNRILLEEANTIINKTFDMIRYSQDHLQSYSSQGKIAKQRSGCALYHNVI